MIYTLLRDCYYETLIETTSQHSARSFGALRWGKNDDLRQLCGPPFLFGGDMSRLNKTALSGAGLSRQSSRTYKVINRKWNADLEKTLRQLDIEHQSNVTKILNERFALRNTHHTLKSESESLAKREKMEILPVINFTASDSFMECASFAMENDGTTGSCINDSEKYGLADDTAKALDDSYKSQGNQNVCRLPIIIEETLSPHRPPRSARSEHCLPPLPAEAFPTRSRKRSERHQEKPAYRTRQRSSTLPVGGVDRWQTVRSAFSDSGSHSKEKRGHDEDLRRAEDESTKLPMWAKNLENCRYLRRRADTSPEILDVESIFRD